jgi:hypothetical protein
MLLLLLLLRRLLYVWPLVMLLLLLLLEQRVWPVDISQVCRQLCSGHDCYQYTIRAHHSRLECSVLIDHSAQHFKLCPEMGNEGFGTHPEV